MNQIKNPLGSLPKPRKPHIIMAKGVSKFLFLFLLSLHSVCSSRTRVGLSYHARGNDASLSASRTISFLKLSKISPSQIRVFVVDLSVLSTLPYSGVSVDLYLNQSLVENLIYSKSSAISWVKTHIMTFLPHVNIKSIIVSSSSSNDLHGLQELLYTLKSIHSILKGSHFDNEVKVSVAFSFSLLENLNSISYEKDMYRIFSFIKKTKSFVVVEDCINGELTVGDRSVESVIERATLAASMLPCDDVPMVLTIKIPTAASASEVAEFAKNASKSLENNTKVKGQIAELYVEVSSMEDFIQKESEREEKQIFPSGRELLSRIKTTLHDTVINPAIPTAPITIPPDNPTPTVITVPSTNPVTIMPTNPDSTPVPVPSTTPVTVPSTNPVNSPLPITNPVTTPAQPGAQPITNPVTTYPAPAGSVPVTTPVTNPVAPPASTNAPAIPGQSWCVVKTGALETAIQAALDYACGNGGADCSQIQQGASCYNPNSLQNHASYAFNSYYQKNPVASSCDFGGTATIVSTNPSTGSCIYPSSASSSTTTTTTTMPSTPIATPATTTPSSSGAGVSGSGAPPAVLNSSNPASGSTIVFGSDSPPSVNTSTTSMSSGLRSFIGCIALVTFLFTGIIILDI